MHLIHDRPHFFVVFPSGVVLDDLYRPSAHVTFRKTLLLHRERPTGRPEVLDGRRDVPVNLLSKAKLRDTIAERVQGFVMQSLHSRRLRRGGIRTCCRQTPSEILSA